VLKIQNHAPSDGTGIALKNRNQEGDCGAQGL